jgi:8-oxo-dGTP pyrophosphatase MutT (NUDIX family)
MQWRPRTTVAAVVERKGRFLLVEERIGGLSVLNQPAGHLDEGESLVHAVVREVREETAWGFRPEGLVGVYRWRVPPAGETFLRFCFHGPVTDHRPERPLDEGILAIHWLTREQVADSGRRLRSPLVTRCIGDYLAGRRYPLALITDMD